MKILSLKSLNKKRQRKKKEKEKIHVPAEYRTRLTGSAGQNLIVRPQMLTQHFRLNFTTFFFFRDNMPIDMNMLVFFLAKCTRTTAKTMLVCGQNKPEGTSCAIFSVGTAAKCCELKRCADRVRSRTDNKDEVLEGKFCN